ncbi:hypothetical protein M433DRAFT_72222 [Acidomyces richmondensis BFW]|nr:MAG: hypothetical protein FE78DRAFT_155103 [Acidomyces sp. 'richmondensis']KYG43193.1 hypothetical protein M433DRAFT_72222 [Acidomyces richmondensis BFW]
MAPIVFGLDLGQMQWSAFKSSNMFGNRDYHLRRTKFIVYQCALIFCVVSESLGTNVLSDYIDQQQFIQSRAPGSYEYNNNYVGAASYNIFAGIYVAFIFGAAFFLDLFWPGRYESKSVRIAWKTTGFLAVLIHLASAITLTCITFIGSAYITGIGQSRARHLLSEFKKDGGVPLRYSHNGRAIAAVVFVWLGWLSVLGR